ncbi:MAG: alpha/beta hydrolase [Pseudomonadales bacterium]|jgi:pimeloyl-ACP methyl ester carboxylesterase
MGVRDELIEMRGLRFHFRDWDGPVDDAPALVMLHGYTGHARSWDRFARALSRRYRVLALDQRGHGETGWAPPDAYGTDEMVADLTAFVAALGLREFTLLGLSMGGQVAIHYAGGQPAELARLVIVDIGPEIIATGMNRIRDNQGNRDVFDTVEDAFAQARAVNPRPPEAHQFERVRDSLMRTADGRWTYRFDRALRDPSVVRARPTSEENWAAVARIRVPTLLLRGELSDILARDVAVRMAETIRDCRLIEIEESGHPIPLDRPERFLEAVEAFLL